MLIIVNHTEEEARAQRELVTKLGGFTLVANEPANSRLVDYGERTSERRILVFEKVGGGLAEKVMLLPPACRSALETMPKIAPLRATKTRLDGRERQSA